MSLNHFQYSYSNEMSQNEHPPQIDNTYRMNSSNNQLNSIDSQNHFKNAKSTSAEYSLYLSSPIKFSFNSTQESDYINEKSTLNFISEFADEEIQNVKKSPIQKQKESLDQFSVIISDNLFFGELEQKIFKWLDDEGVKHVSPQDKIDKYYEEKKSLVSFQILSYQQSIQCEDSCNNTEPKTTTSIRKVSLLERRRQQNKNINTPSSCINLGQFTEFQQIEFQTQYSL